MAVKPFPLSLCRIVGAGTYVFKLSESQNVDATCSGNIAHLLNHSCEPSCYSRVVTVDGCNHVVIFAKRDLEPGEELTYDYRSPPSVLRLTRFRRCKRAVLLDGRGAMGTELVGRLAVCDSAAILRFGSSEKLPCNCGAPRCRGYVNIDDPDLELCSGAQPWTVLRSELRPWKPPNSAVGGGGGNGDTADPQAQLDADPLVPDNAAKSLHCGASQVPSAM